jgi:bifunctional DNA-binding transcriptional regulator/antitoxin component of YhaV-PrlF toxin-antitoxin module
MVEMYASNLDFDSITKNLRTKSDKIRALAREGAATADIARYLGIRYQHARNVLVSSGLHTAGGQKSAGDHPAGAPSAASAASGDWIMLDGAGRLQIPADMLRAAGIKAGEQVHVRVGTDAVEILSQRAALERARQIVSKFVPPGVSLVDELIAERRREAEHEGG